MSGVDLKKRRMSVETVHKRPRGMTITESTFKILEILREKGKATPKEIRDGTGLAKSTVTLILKTLVRWGVIEKTSNITDMRYMWYRLIDPNAPIMTRSCRTVLKVLEKHGTMSARDISECCNLGIRTIAHALKRLVEWGLAKKFPNLMDMRQMMYQAVGDKG